MDGTSTTCIRSPVSMFWDANHKVQGLTESAGHIVGHLIQKDSLSFVLVAVEAKFHLRDSRLTKHHGVALLGYHIGTLANEDGDIKTYRDSELLGVHLDIRVGYPISYPGRTEFCGFLT
ncbi:hypothetical protein CHS0354_020980 [Potamilus streckersoni]|uniref:Uncharacterized protein n=1 Tax=Potamilus streckersoni TaxID=2493646 RepID=A0AAE0W4X5_9BIVA|nr:hypothetical protein CHS0354_020980 [Potamilus streckersoni]